MTHDVNNSKGKIPDGMNFSITDIWRKK